MSETVWKAVDDYLFGALIGPDAALDEALKANAAAGLPGIDGSPAQGKVPYLLAKRCGARRGMEVGTLGGYSTIWLGRAVGAGGSVITLELEQKHADVAREN